MSRTPSRDTAAELLVRSAVHRRGLRFFVDRPPLRGARRRADLVFPRVQVAVYVDGCFWHGCPLHGTWPKHNADYWRGKIEANRARDEMTNAELRSAGWAVVRIWEHEDPEVAADRIVETVRGRLSELGSAAAVAEAQGSAPDVRRGG